MPLRLLGLLAFSTLAFLPKAGAAGPSPSPQTARAAKLAAAIDRHLDASLKANKIAATPRSSDAEFLRRVHLDIAGRIPTASEARAFLADERPDRRERLIGRLLDGPAFTNHLAQVFRSAWAPQASTNLRTQHLGLSLEAWIAQQLRHSSRYDLLVRNLLTARLEYLERSPAGPSSPLSTISATAFYQAGDLEPSTVTGNVARLFLGIRLECAQCHNHPFDKWTRTQFWQTAAFFASVAPPEPGQTPAHGESPSLRKRIEDTLTHKNYNARFLDGGEPAWGEQPDPRSAFAAWLTRADNPYFARVAVNRVWAQFFGIGLVDPVDDFGSHNDPSHPELLAELATQFSDANFDLKFLVRAITLSRAYQRTSRRTDPRQNDPRLYASGTVKGLSPEQLFDSLALATGYREEVPRAARAAFGFEARSPRGQFLATFGGGSSRTDTQTSILQALALMNGDWMARQTDPEKGETLRAVLNAPFLDDEGKLETLYLAALARFPRESEKARFLTELKRSAPDNKKQVFADLLWVLLNSHEFLLNH